jgi:hypothetical protein
MHVKTNSYASAVANVVSQAGSWSTAKPSLESQVKELSQPPPQSLTLTAALHLLGPVQEHSDVYLMTRSYMQNWLIWAHNENVPKAETQRVQTALRLAADRLGLQPPTYQSKYNDPGPVNNSSLSLEGFPLLLNPNVILRDGTSDKMSTSKTVEDLIPRVQSLPNPSDPPNASRYQSQETNGNLDVEGDNIICCAVPAKFYEVRHGIFSNVLKQREKYKS